jgi:hypothetical protein
MVVTGSGAEGFLVLLPPQNYTRDVVITNSHLAELWHSHLMHVLNEPAFPATIFLRSPSSSGNLSLKNLRALPADAILAKEPNFLADPQKHASYFSDGRGFSQEFVNSLPFQFGEPHKQQRLEREPEAMETDLGM